MLQIARLAPKLLGEAQDLIGQFLLSQQHSSGAFVDRRGDPDLYYTVFGVEGLRALQWPFDESQLRAYLTSLGAGDTLDFVHLCCLVRAWANLGIDDWPSEHRQKAHERLLSFRSQDGGFEMSPGAKQGTVYSSFLAFGALQDGQWELSDEARFLESIESQRSKDGGYSNQPAQAVGLTPPTAAAMTLRRHFQHDIDRELGDWLLERIHPEGGFRVSALIPMPDLLSTATALHALTGIKRSLGPLSEPCIDFVDTLWTNRGGFFGHWQDDVIDCEYTYYALLALGHLSL